MMNPPMLRKERQMLVFELAELMIIIMILYIYTYIQTYSDKYVYVCVYYAYIYLEICFQMRKPWLAKDTHLITVHWAGEQLGKSVALDLFRPFVSQRLSFCRPSPEKCWCWVSAFSGP